MYELPILAQSGNPNQQRQLCPTPEKKFQKKSLSRRSSKCAMRKNLGNGQEDEEKNIYGKEPMNHSQEQYSSHKVLKSNNNEYVDSISKFKQPNLNESS